ncbi:SDR family oxidoreductase [Nonomuraea basaltis]|uniref:SDR family oxidoreductase n=1 Tax=Nonomuraea basaltis TaxID=2495887 RepID=UPI00110C4F61|nr:SDR family oxidoreductase [Nonomuraea basaltis]TMR95143.1 SDR family oxidoreductase [Nonomuraea basaltis]
MSEGGTFLVTGATGPVAEATIALLAKRGDALLLTGRNEARLAELERTYGTPGRIETFATDVTTEQGATAAAEAALSRLGRLDGLIHMVGSFHAGPVFLTRVAEYDRLMRVNFLSAVCATQAVLPHLGNGGRLVFFGSPLASEPLAALGGYAAGKAALLAWMRALSHEVKHQGIHANAVIMTMADTPQARQERPHVDFDQAITPELVARAVAFLTGEGADGLYGGLVPVMGRFGFSSALAGPPPKAG